MSSVLKERVDKYTALLEASSSTHITNRTANSQIDHPTIRRYLGMGRHKLNFIAAATTLNSQLDDLQKTEAHFLAKYRRRTRNETAPMLPFWDGAMDFSQVARNLVNQKARNIAVTLRQMKHSLVGIEQHAATKEESKPAVYNFISRADVDQSRIPSHMKSGMAMRTHFQSPLMSAVFEAVEHALVEFPAKSAEGRSEAVADYNPRGLISPSLVTREIMELLTPLNKLANELSIIFTGSEPEDAAPTSTSAPHAVGWNGAGHAMTRARLQRRTSSV